jgi:hypothetical protein
MSNANTIDEILKAMNAHGAWKLRLRSAIVTGNSDVSPEVAKCDDKCDFGKWLLGSSGTAEVRGDAHYQRIRQLHADFHKSAGEVLQSALNNQTDRANALLAGSFSEQSHTLMVELTKWKRELTPH